MFEFGNGGSSYPSKRRAVVADVDPRGDARRPPVQEGQQHE